jgi:hypothetical protein
MKKTKQVECGHPNKCSKCGATLINPGYGRTGSYCCGMYQKWYEFEHKTVAYDDGRDARGRFAKKVAI